MTDDVVNRLKELMKNEAKSCSMDFGGITPLYVYRMWGGEVALSVIERAMPIAMELCLKDKICNDI